MKLSIQKTNNQYKLMIGTNEFVDLNVSDLTFVWLEMGFPLEELTFAMNDAEENGYDYLSFGYFKQNYFGGKCLIKN